MAKPIALKCPSCDAPLTAPPGRGQFYCQFCGTPVVIPKAEESNVSKHRGSSKKRAVAIPEKLRVEDYGGELRITWSWFQWAGLFLIPFCIAWNAFLIGWYSIAMAGEGLPWGMKFIMLIFPIAHVAVGLGLLYTCLVLLMNRTTVRITFGELRISHGPIPAPGNRKISVDDIDQLYVKHERQQKNDSTSHNYPLIARLKSGQEIKLLPRNNEVDVARAVEQLVENHLNIQDQLTAGEYRG